MSDLSLLCSTQIHAILAILPASEAVIYHTIPISLSHGRQLDTQFGLTIYASYFQFTDVSLALAPVFVPQRSSIKSGRS